MKESYYYSSSSIVVGVERYIFAHSACMYDHTPVLSTCPLHTNSGCGKERRILIDPW